MNFKKSNGLAGAKGNGSVVNRPVARPVSAPCRKSSNTVTTSIQFNSIDDEMNYYNEIIYNEGYIGFEVGGSVTSLGTGSTILYDCEEVSRDRDRISFFLSD